MESKSHNKDFIFFVFLINLDFGGFGRISDSSLIHCFRIIVSVSKNIGRKIMNQRRYITSFGNVQRYCQDFVFTCTLSCAHAYTNAIFKCQNLTKFGLIFKEMAKLIPLTHIVKSLFQCTIFEDFLNLRGFGRGQGGEGRGSVLFCKCLNTQPIIQISASLKF